MEIQGRAVPHSLGDMLHAAAAADPTRAAVVFQGTETSYGALDAMATALAAWLQAQGIGQGDRVALYVINSPWFVAAYYAVVRLGAVVVPINLLLNAEEVAYILTDAGVRGIIFHEAFAATVAAVLPGTPQVQVRVVVGSGEPAGATPLASIVQTAAPEFVPPRLEPATDLAAIIYTSGTTGRAKGAMLTHRNLLANATAASLALGTDRHDRFLIVLPMFHSFAGTCGVILPLLCRGTIIAVPRFVPDDVARIMAEQRATVFLGVPSMYTIFAHLPADRRPDFAALRVAVSGGAALPVEVMERFEARYGIPIVEGDGPTECGPVTAVNPIGGVRKAGTIGLPVPTVEMRIVDETGAELPTGQIGEIVVRGPSVTRGYWQRPEATAEAFFGDWFRTGDLGCVDADGYFSIVDRKKDLIIVNGMNVYPRQVEEVIHRLPQVAEVAVVPEPERLHGEVPRAVITLRAGEQLSAREVVDHCRQHLGRFQVPRIVEFVEALPKNAAGKILKRALMRTGEVERGVDSRN